MRMNLRVGLLAGLLAGSLGMGSEAAVFDLGVGAFEIGQRDAILWTHVDPQNPKGKSVSLHVRVATDASFQNVLQTRKVKARAEEDFTVRRRVSGLAPSSQYFYQFSTDKAFANGVLSRVGSFRTAPLVADGAPVRFVISGDSNLGYTRPRGLDFHVLSAAAADDPDFFAYFGDTIYADSGVLPSGNAQTLDEYRDVHRQTRADPHLQELLASTGTFTGWDDHEVRNDYAGETVDPAQFMAGARAFFEYLPLQEKLPKLKKAMSGKPKKAMKKAGTPVFRTDRNVRWGKHVELFFLDGRQFRSAEQFCNATLPDGPEGPDTLFSPFPEDEAIAFQILEQGGLEAFKPDLEALLTPSDPDCVETLLAAPGRTLLGSRQLDALKQALLASTATFKIIVNNTPLSTLLFVPYDRWEGYLQERQELFDFIAANLDPDHVLVLTTDFHTNLAIRRSELTEILVGPIGQETFGQSVFSLLPPGIGSLGSLVFILIDGLIAEANGGFGTVVGSAPDAFSYAVVDAFEDPGGAPRLRVAVRGNPGYLAGGNDPADVIELFSVELP